MMKQLKIVVGILVSSWLVPASLYAQFTETKEISKQYRVNPETRIEISNKYGKVELNTWEKDSVAVEIKIRVEEKKQSKLEKSIDKIDFDFTSSQHFLIIRTKVGENAGTLEKELMRFKETLFQSGGGNMEIDYSVWLPKTNNLKVENKFGDIFIGDYSGEVEIDLSNGNLKSHDFEGRTKIILNFADATVNEMKNARINSNYSDLYIKKAKSLRITGKSSSFEILEINELYADSRRDKYRIRLADMVEAQGSFSNFRLNELNDRLTLRAEYGDLDIEKTASDFSNIYIESKSTDINLWFYPETDFGFEITHTKSEVNTGREIEIEEKETLDEKEGKVKLSGFFNKKEGSTKKLFINANSGEINIFSK